MRPLQCIKRIVLVAFVIEVTSHPTPYGSRLINFLGNSIGYKTAVGCGNNCDEGRHHHNQKNIGTGSDSSLVEISFQPLRELESVSSLTSLYHPLLGKQYFDEDPRQLIAAKVVTAASPTASAPPFYLSTSHNHRPRHFYRSRRHRPFIDDELKSYRQRYPDESSPNEEPLTAISGSPVVGIPYPAEKEETEDPFGFMQNGQQSSIIDGRDFSQEERDKLNSRENFGWDVFKGETHPPTKGPPEEYNCMDLNINNKRNALAAYKRQKFKSHQTQFFPSISGGSMANLGEFFKSLKNNIDFMEKSRLTNTNEILLEGDHPTRMLKDELNSDVTKTSGTSAFLHAIRTYRPSQRIRSLVALNPEGYHGSQFLDPNYMWLGLGKR